MANAREVVQKAYDLFARGNLEGFLELCAEDIEWVVNGPASLEKCRAFRGRPGVRRFFEILSTGWDFRSFTPRQYIVEGPTVVVLGEEAGTDKVSGEQFENRWAHVFEVLDGRIVRFREFLCHWKGGERPPQMSWDR